MKNDPQVLYLIFDSMMAVLGNCNQERLYQLCSPWTILPKLIPKKMTSSKQTPLS